jgi:hypothetical protein
VAEAEGDINGAAHTAPDHEASTVKLAEEQTDGLDVEDHRTIEAKSALDGFVEQLAAKDVKLNMNMGDNLKNFFSVDEDGEKARLVIPSSVSIVDETMTVEEGMEVANYSETHTSETYAEYIQPTPYEQAGTTGIENKDEHEDIKDDLDKTILSEVRETEEQLDRILDKVTVEVATNKESVAETIGQFEKGEANGYPTVFTDTLLEDDDIDIDDYYDYLVGETFEDHDRNISSGDFARQLRNVI